MIPPEIAAVVERAVARTGHRRFRALLDPEHPDHNPRYLALVERLASDAPVPAETRRGKPVMALGRPQRPPPGCRTCGQPSQ